MTGRDQPGIGLEWIERGVSSGFCRCMTHPFPAKDAGLCRSESLVALFLNRRQSIQRPILNSLWIRACFSFFIYLLYDNQSFGRLISSHDNNMPLSSEVIEDRIKRVDLFTPNSKKAKCYDRCLHLLLPQRYCLRAAAP
jgi:hypothetical protein